MAEEIAARKKGLLLERGVSEDSLLEFCVCRKQQHHIIAETVLKTQEGSASQMMNQHQIIFPRHIDNTLYWISVSMVSKSSQMNNDNHQHKCSI